MTITPKKLGSVDIEILCRFLSQNCANQGELSKEIQVFSRQFIAELRNFGQKAVRKINNQQTLATSFILGCVALFSACTGSNSTAVIATPVSNNGVAQVWVTTADKSKLLAQEADVAIASSTDNSTIINVDATEAYQTMVGVGASFTDASVYLMQNKLAPDARQAIIQDLYSKRGIGLNFARLTIGASDFSRSHYSYDDVPRGQSDPLLNNFSLDPAKSDLLPILKLALAVNPDLKIMASPWSAPGWMKTSYSMIGGTLRPEFYRAFANYLVRYVEAMKAEGVNIFALTMQNEPHFSPTNYPGMVVTDAERANFFANHLGPLMAARLPNTKIFEWDHNWSEPLAATNVLADSEARKYVDAVAWHCYGGSPAAQTQVHDAYPDKDVYFTECSGGQWDTNFGSSLEWQTSNLIIGTMRNWAKGVLFWNLALDEKFGPHLGGCGDCRGVLTINSETGEVTKNVEYYVLGHFGRFVAEGAKRIKSDSAIDGIETVAFLNPDGGRKAIIVLNTNGRTHNFTVRDRAKNINYSLPANSVATIVW
ncbi:MAG: glucosylceramidase [Hyphomonadaceae bacterium]|nr:MAG: glucosylceramidase [Hyphomonadaceae bacterium]KAF0186777.1 MAG: glucosylceramidase [Hyphomonadaceae bacterium]